MTILKYSKKYDEKPFSQFKDYPILYLNIAKNAREKSDLAKISHTSIASVNHSFIRATIT